MVGTPKRSLAGLAVVTILLVAAGWTIITYNRMVRAQQSVDAQWAQVESVYQRRANLVPNLVAATQGYLVQEREVIQALLRARGSYAQTPCATAAIQRVDPGLSTQPNRQGRRVQDATLLPR